MNLLAGRPVVILVIIAAIVRGGVLWMAFGQLHDDPDAYDAIARTLATTGTFAVVAAGDDTVPTAYRPPLYPAILAVIHRVSHSPIIATEEDLQDPLFGGKTPVSRTAIAVLHWAMSLATVVITYFVALEMLRPIAGAAAVPNSQSTSDPIKLPAFFAALLVAIDPILIQSSVRVMTETLAALLAVATLYCWCRLVDRMAPEAVKKMPIFAATALLGLVLGLAYLCRPTFIVWTALLIGYLSLWSAWRMCGAWLQRSRRRESAATGESGESISDGGNRFSPAVAAIMLVFVTSLFVGGWTLRNQKHFGKPIWATTHGGYTLLLGNNPSFFAYMRSGKIGIAWDPQPFFDRWETRDQADPRRVEFWESETPLPSDTVWQATLRDSEVQGELLEDHLAYETAKMAIANDYEGFIHATLWRVGRLLSPMPQVFAGASNGKRIGAAVVTIYYSATVVLVIGGIFRLSRNLLRPHWIAAIMLVLSLVAVHAIYWSNMRMRAPAIPALAILAAVPLCKSNRNRNQDSNVIVAFRVRRSSPGN